MVVPSSSNQDPQLSGTDCPAFTHKSSQSQRPASARRAPTVLSAVESAAAAAIRSAIGRNTPPRTTPPQNRARYGPRRIRRAASVTSWTDARSEEHTSELQSHSDLVCRLLLEKKKKENK